jgi:hypothetical protein
MVMLFRWHRGSSSIYKCEYETIKKKPEFYAPAFLLNFDKCPEWDFRQIKNFINLPAKGRYIIGQAGEIPTSRPAKRYVPQQQDRASGS